jgi:hypothetical protein
MGEFDIFEIEDAHTKTFRQRNALEESSICGCCYCRAIFPPCDIKEWCDRGKTAMCPVCSIDCVIGDSSGYPITKDFLDAMHEYWFKPKDINNWSNRF